MKNLLKNITLTLLFLSVCYFKQHSAQAQFKEYEIKGGMVAVITKFVSWPDPEYVFKDGNKIILGILGDDPFGETIERILRGRPVNGKVWVVRRGNSLTEIKGSHVIFITKSKEKEAAKVLEDLNKQRKSHVLTIGDDINGFLEAGGIINLERNNLFKINSDAVNKAQLIIDVRLWNMAREIEIQQSLNK